METKKNKQRSVIAVVMQKRYGSTTTVMHDRRLERGGARNKQKQYRNEEY